MKITDPELRIRDEARRLSHSIPNLSWYLFGSSLENIDSANDLDILIIYQHLGESELIRAALDQFLISLPVHLTLLTTEEELELDFVQTERCKKLFP